MKLILNRPVKYHLAADIVDEFEKTILLSDNTPETVVPASPKLSNLAFHIWRFLSKCGVPHTPLSYFKFRNLKNPDEIQLYFAVLMGTDFRKCLPYFMLPVRKSIYMFDAWPSAHSLILQFVSHFGLEHVFLSSSQAVERLNTIEGKSRFHWIPEGIDHLEYRSFQYADKDIDVVAFGRQYLRYHEKIKEPLRLNNKVYLNARTEGTKTFPLFTGKEAFINALARSKVSICVPSSISNPDRAGEIETMTIRYLQSMISKCLIVGHAPEEMIRLFGYNPVIEIDKDNEGSQIIDILANYHSYFDLIEKNHQKVIEGHTWKHRWGKILEILA